LFETEDPPVLDLDVIADLNANAGPARSAAADDAESVEVDGDVTRQSDC
jgi:hypothetical protein